MHQILIVIPFCKADAQRAENLLDWLRVLSNGKPNGFALLVAANDVHQEAIEKIKVSAELAFEQFDTVKLSAPVPPEKNAAINAMFKTIARHVQQNYRVPWFWCEPDVTPLKPRWIEELAGHYYNQPRRYAGSMFWHGKTLFPARCITYPPDAIADYEPFCTSNQPFNLAAASITAKMSLHRICQEILIETLSDCDKVKPDACLCHADKNSIALADCESARDKAARASAARRLEAVAT